MEQCQKTALGFFSSFFICGKPEPLESDGHIRVLVLTVSITPDLVNAWQGTWLVKWRRKVAPGQFALVRQVARASKQTS